MRRRSPPVALLLILALTHWPGATTFAQEPGLYTTWRDLLSSAVHTHPAGIASEVDYALLKQRRVVLDEVTQRFSAVDQDRYSGWSRTDQLAFLINAYNAFTLQLVLTRYPDLASIRDLGSLFSSPWKKRFFSLLGKPRTLDELEHEMIRGQFDEPRIHAAVNCASCGCPALRDEPFEGHRLEVQLDAAMQSFLGDQARNRYDAGDQTLWLSPIFKWYREDFADGDLGAWLVPYRDALGAPPDPESSRIRFMRYDWGLNDLGRCFAQPR